MLSRDPSRNSMHQRVAEASGPSHRQSEVIRAISSDYSACTGLPGPSHRTGSAAASVLPSLSQLCRTRFHCRSLTSRRAASSPAASGRPRSSSARQHRSKLAVECSYTTPPRPAPRRPIALRGTQAGGSGLPSPVSRISSPVSRLPSVGWCRLSVVVYPLSPVASSLLLSSLVSRLPSLVSVSLTSPFIKTVTVVGSPTRGQAKRGRASPLTVTGLAGAEAGHVVRFGPRSHRRWPATPLPPVMQIGECAGELVRETARGASTHIDADSAKTKTRETGDGRRR